MIHHSYIQPFKYNIRHRSSKPWRKFFLLLTLKNSAWARLPGICIFNFCENFYQSVQIFTMFHVFRLQPCITTITSGSSRAPRQCFLSRFLCIPMKIAIFFNDEFSSSIASLTLNLCSKGRSEEKYASCRSLSLFFFSIFSSRFHESILLFFFVFSFFRVFRHVAI